jgi:hypothetical protein
MGFKFKENGLFWYVWHLWYLWYFIRHLWYLWNMRNVYGNKWNMWYPFLKFKGAVLGFGMVIIASSSGFYRVR